MSQDSLLQMPKYFKTTDCILQVQGDKAAQLLHGQFTNSIKDLPLGQGNYNLFLTNKGKVLADLFVWHKVDGYYLIVPKIFVELIFSHLQKIASLSRCAIRDVTDDLLVCHVLGNIPPIFASMQLGQIGQINELGVAGLPLSGTVFCSHRLGWPGCDVLVLQNQLSYFENQGMQELSENDQDVLRIKALRARVGVDATETNLPQEARLDQALHFNKGCYLGQEVIARLHFKGHVNKILVGLVADSTNIKIGDQIYDGEMVVGKITSTAVHPLENKLYMLGYVPVALSQTGQLLHVLDMAIQRPVPVRVVA